jgi:hypothetical protein
MPRIHGWIARNRHFFSLITALSLYVVSCATPAMDEPEKSSMRGMWDNPATWTPPPPFEGWRLLGLGFLCPTGTTAWWANVAFFLGVVCFSCRRYPSGFALGLIALILGATTWIECRYEHKYVGYYLWQASHLSLALGSLWAWRSVHREHASLNKGSMSVALPPDKIA